MKERKEEKSSLHWIISLSFSICDIIVTQKGSNGERKLHVNLCVRYEGTKFNYSTKMFKAFLVLNKSVKVLEVTINLRALENLVLAGALILILCEAFLASI